jgi:hypothetical protein
MVPTPQGQQIMVAVPAGVVAGQMFQVQLPAAPAAVAGSPEQVLEASTSLQVYSLRQNMLVCVMAVAGGAVMLYVLL